MVNTFRALCILENRLKEVTLNGALSLEYEWHPENVNLPLKVAR